MDADKTRGLDILMASMDDLVSLMKLQFGVSTGAVVLFVHAIVDSHIRPLLDAILIVAALCFGFSAIQCLQVLGHLAKFKSVVGDTYWRGEGEFVADVFEKKAKADIEAGQSKAYKMDRFFGAGVISSVIFLIAHFIYNFRQ